jgi:hypothetical protein
MEVFHLLRFQVNVIEPDKQKGCQVLYLEGMHMLRQQQKKGPFLIFHPVLMDIVRTRPFYDVYQFEESVPVGANRTLIQLLVFNLVWFEKVVDMHYPQMYINNLGSYKKKGMLSRRFVPLILLNNKK